jgi:hypothetical protein
MHCLLHRLANDPLHTHPFQRARFDFPAKHCRMVCFPIPEKRPCRDENSQAIRSQASDVRRASQGVRRARPSGEDNRKSSSNPSANCESAGSPRIFQSARSRIRRDSAGEQVDLSLQNENGSAVASTTTAKLGSYVGNRSCRSRGWGKSEQRRGGGGGRGGK